MIAPFPIPTMTGQLPRKAWQGTYDPCAKYIHEGMEDNIPIYRQKHQK